MSIGMKQLALPKLGKFNQYLSATIHHSVFMVQGSPVPKVVQWIVVQIGPLLSTQDIANYTDLSEHKVRHILMHF
jgi:hypothetical protein